MKDLSKLVASILGCELVGILSTPFTITAIPTWYSSLQKPSFAPPNWIFAPAWTTLYALIGVSFYLIWSSPGGSATRQKKVNTAMKFFGAQLALNFFWSPIFFGLRSPLLALIDILAMWVLIVMTMQKFKELSKPAFYLLIPYLLWVSFATMLNIAIVVLN